MRDWIRRKPALATLCGLALVLLIGAGSWLVYLNHQLSDVPRFDAGLDRPDRPERVQADKALNILLVGVDDGKGNDLTQQLQSGDWVEGSFRSDTMMVWHLDSEWQTSQVVSLPRDGWVDIPGRGEAKLNAAFSWGGPELLVETVEENFEVYIDHVAVIDFEGFKDVTRTLGGVQVQTPDGPRTLEGDAALKYVRARKTLPHGDFDRIRRQQNFLRATLQQVMAGSTRANPLRLTQLAGDLGQLVALDEDFDNGLLRDLATHVARHGAGRIDWLTVPHDGTGRRGSQSVVELDMAAATTMFQSISADDFDAYRKHHDLDRLPAPDAVN